MRTFHTHASVVACFAVVLLGTLFMGATCAAGEATGVDSILEYAGQEKPADWTSWSREERFAYLQSMGLYPDGRKYHGNVSDYSEYFAWLGIEPPDAWDSFTFEERHQIVLAATRKTAQTDHLPLGDSIRFGILAGILSFATWFVYVIRKNSNVA